MSNQSPAGDSASIKQEQIITGTRSLSQSVTYCRGHLLNYDILFCSFVYVGLMEAFKRGPRTKPCGTPHMSVCSDASFTVNVFSMIY